jgi:hypothetical protein
MLMMDFGAFCNYQMLWDKPVVIVAYSFKGIVFKSLVVEAHKRVYQRPMNDLDFEIHKYCELFLNNLKGVVFYNVSHTVVLNIYQNISNGNVNKSLKI